MPYRLLVFIAICGSRSIPAIGEVSESDLEALFSNIDVDVFYEIRAGYRIRKDKYQKDMSIVENHLQLDISSYTDWADFKFRCDFFAG